MSERLDFTGTTAIVILAASGMGRALYRRCDLRLEEDVRGLVQRALAEIANAILWLCSDQASYVTGATLPVDGGFLAP